MTPTGVSLACCESEHQGCTYPECACGCHVGPKPKGDPFCHVCGGEGEVTTDGANVVKCPRCGEGS